MDIFLPALCFLPLFHGVLPLFAFDIFNLLNLSLSPNSFESSLEHSSSIFGRPEWTPTCETSQTFCPFLSWTKPLRSRVATALIKSRPFLNSRCLTLEFSSLGRHKDFHALDSLFSFAKVNGIDESSPWTKVWTLTARKWLCKAGCAAPISATRYQHYSLSNYHQEAKLAQLCKKSAFCEFRHQEHSTKFFFFFWEGIKLRGACGTIIHFQLRLLIF